MPAPCRLVITSNAHSAPGMIEKLGARKPRTFLPVCCRRTLTRNFLTLVAFTPKENFLTPQIQYVTMEQMPNRSVDLARKIPSVFLRASPYRLITPVNNRMAVLGSGTCPVAGSP